MGDIEWSEGIFANQDDADRVCSWLWESRSSKYAPEWCKGFCKFAVEHIEVLGS